MKKILITGGAGQLALALLKHPEAKSFALTHLNHSECDISDEPALTHCLNQHAPEVIINTAAYTAVDLAESEPEKADAANHLGARHLAAYCKTKNIRLLHISTDYVFDGEANTAYKEDAPIHPVNYYGQSKAAGEQAIRETLDNHLILRVSGVFSEHGKNFLKTMLTLAKTREYLSVVTDQTTCPTDAHAIAGALYQIIKQEKHRGTYHFCSEPPITWHHFAACIFGSAIADYNAEFKLHTFKRITTKDYPTAAKRPAYAVLDCEKIQRDFGITQPHWQAGIDRVLTQLMKEST
jgi:dTDP-4-dehydrorhamnose reductase